MINLGLSMSLSRRAILGEVPSVTIAEPTYFDDFAYTDGTRLVDGDPNDDYGLGVGNPGNLGWDALTNITPTNARYNTVVFGGQLRVRTANATGDNTQPGTYFMSPPATQGGDMYARFNTSGTASASDTLRVGIQGTGRTQRLEIEFVHTSAVTRLRQVNVGVTNGTNIESVTPVSAGRRLGGLNGQLRQAVANETLTILAVNGRGYLRRGPGYPIGPTAGSAIPAFAGDRFGVPTIQNRGRWVDNLRVGPAPLFITVDEDHRYWVPKKRSSASDPITNGVGDATFTGAYVGTAPSKMQWALADLGTGEVLTEWETVSSDDFTASGGTWSARLRSIPSRVNGRSAYGVGFRPVDANDQTDPAWQCFSNREFFVSLNIGVIGQSNSAFFAGNTVANGQYARNDGLTSYVKADPPSLVFGLDRQEPQFWSAATTGVAITTKVNFLLADYLANLYSIPVSTEALGIPARGAPVLGPIDAVTGEPHPNSDWNYIQTHHAFAGGAYDFLYLSQGENEFAALSQAQVWALRWTAHLNAYRDPSMSGQPSGTVVPVLLAMTGRNTGTLLDNEAANTVRQQQLILADTVPDVYMAHSYTGVKMIDASHYSNDIDEGYSEVARRLMLTYDHLFNGGAYDGRGPIATSATRTGAVLDVTFDLNGASSLVARNGEDQALSGNASALTSWEASTDDFATTLTVNSAEIVGNGVRLTLSADPGGPVKVRNHYGQNPDITSFPAGSYSDGTFICMMPLVVPIETAS